MSGNEVFVQAFEDAVGTVYVRADHDSDNALADLFSKMIQFQLLEIVRLARLGLEKEKENEQRNSNHQDSGF